MKKIFFIICLFIFSHNTLATNELTIILDSSSSMSEDDGTGKTKIEVAKDIVRELINKAKVESKSISLLTFGGDCNSVNEIVKPSSNFSSQEIHNAISNVEADGSTPLAFSVKKAGEILIKRNKTSNVIVITDGAETCDGDPCKEAKNLRFKRKINVTFNIVGYQVSDSDISKLSCVAKETGGTVVNIEKSEDLKQAVEQVITTGVINFHKIQNYIIKRALMLDFQLENENTYMIRKRAFNTPSNDHFWQDITVQPGDYRLRVFGYKWYREANIKVKRNKTTTVNSKIFKRKIFDYLPNKLDTPKTRSKPKKSTPVAPTNNTIQKTSTNTSNEILY